MILRLTRNGLFILAISAFMLISLVLYLLVDDAAPSIRRMAESGLQNLPISENDEQKLMENVEMLKSQLSANEILRDRLNRKLDEMSPAEANMDDKKGVVVAPPVPPPEENLLITNEMDRYGGKWDHGNKVEKVFQFQKEKLLRKNEQQQRYGTNFMHGEFVCPVVEPLNHNANGDVQMLNAYEIIPFDNLDGGAWKQGWDITYDSMKIKEEKPLEVVIVPHSHNDPGWLRTFEDYYETQTVNILNGMVKYLSENSDMKFIFAEMSFFELWWSKIDDIKREKVKGFVKNGQLELVTGGWVMTDEANSHYYSIIMEMIEGHEFLQNQLGFKPTSHWSIDPFGLSPTLAYLMNRANLTHMAVQRVHYSVKKYLAKNRQLEFKWRQLFAGKSTETDITTHMFPFFSYDVPHTCGPDPAVCCQFDFVRQRKFFCPWGKPVLPITETNVAQRAKTLADQYRKKAQLYRENTVLIPLGDDFRYDSDYEWEQQHSNYKQLIEHINQQKDLNMHVQFGTLKDYFSILDKRLADENFDEDKSDKNLPILSGDFFTYADRDDHYWSGYFTSRPFYKHMDRTLQHYLRSADILFTLAGIQASHNNVENTKFLQLYDQLVEARRALSLFQHHDGVTGTGKAHVVLDYAMKMLNGINNCKLIISNCAEFLMKYPTSRDEEPMKIDEEHFKDRQPVKIVTEDGSSVLVFNPLAQIREEVVCIHVNSIKSRIRLTDSENPADIPQQIGPILFVDPSGGQITYHNDKFELCFLSVVQAIGFSRYSIFEANDMSHKIRIKASENFNSPFFELNEIGSEGKLSFKNDYLKAKFDSNTGYLSNIAYKNKDGKMENLDIISTFVHYGARSMNSAKPGDSVSGAYLFLPDGPAKELNGDENIFAIISGSVRQYIFIKGPKEIGIRQIVSMDINSQSLKVENLINLNTKKAPNKQMNYELAWRLKIPSIKNDKFFTDLNGFQMIRRRRFDKLPLQAQFYPMPGAVFLEEEEEKDLTERGGGVRVSLLGRQALGVASLETGTMEVMLDRRLISDDDRGLGEPVLDNHETLSSFQLFVESLLLAAKPPISTTNSKKNEEETIGYHSLPANYASLRLHYPPMILIGQLDHSSSAEVLSNFTGLNQQLPCDVHLVGLRRRSSTTVYGDDGLRKNLVDKSASMILHRFGADCNLNTPLTVNCENTHGKVHLNSIFNSNLIRSIVPASLTLLYESQKSLNNEENKPIELNPMELYTSKINF